MIKSKLFIRFAVVGVLVSGSFLVLSIFTTQWMRSLIFDEPFRDRGPFKSFEILLDKISPTERVEALIALRAQGPRAPDAGPGAGSDADAGADPAASGALTDSPPPPPEPPAPPDETPLPEVTPAPNDGRGPDGRPSIDMVLLNAKGVVLYPSRVDDEKLVEIKSLIERLKTSDNVRVIGENFIARKLSGEPAQYFARGMRFKPPPPPMGTLLFLNSIQLATIIAAVLVTLVVVLYSLRARARQADSVMKELSRGNLKARIPITKMDEVGQTMFSFNKMADEIEHLIEHLRKTENARKDLLRELAHDLRTPVASLKSLIETVAMRADQLPKEKLRELLDLAMKEADYFEGLVDDLLFLGRVGEPKYKASVEKFDLAELVDLEIDSISARYPNIEVELRSSLDSIDYDGDPNLIKRLVRNALENAASFARSKVTLDLAIENGAIVMHVADDGPGFDATSLASFGQRKYSRAMTQAGSTRRISIGLGSVIMKSITDAHRGDLTASNRQNPSGEILGAQVSVRLPLI